MTTPTATPSFNPLLVYPDLPVHLLRKLFKTMLFLVSRSRFSVPRYSRCLPQRQNQTQNKLLPFIMSYGHTTFHFAVSLPLQSLSTLSSKVVSGTYPLPFALSPGVPSLPVTCAYSYQTLNVMLPPVPDVYVANLHPFKSSPITRKTPGDKRGTYPSTLVVDSWSVLFL